MPRFFVFVIVVGGLVVALYATKPTEADYLRKLDDRAAAIAALDNDAFSELRVGDPLDEMLASQSSTQLLDQTRVDDYFVISVFTTEYHTPGYGPRKVHTYGLFATLVSFRDE
jgi:hypothetical protein